MPFVLRHLQSSPTVRFCANLAVGAGFKKETNHACAAPETSPVEGCFAIGCERVDVRFRSQYQSQRSQLDSVDDVCEWLAVLKVEPSVLRSEVGIADDIVQRCPSILVSCPYICSLRE